MSAQCASPSSGEGAGRFFQDALHRHVRYGVGIAEFHRLVCQQAHGWAASSRRCLRTGQGDQTCLEGAVELQVWWGSLRLFALQGGLKAIFNEALFQAFDGSCGDAERLCDAGDRPTWSMRPLVAKQQCACVEEAFGAGACVLGQGCQVVAFLQRQGYPVAWCHGKPPWLSMIKPSLRRIQCYGVLVLRHSLFFVY